MGCSECLCAACRRWAVYVGVYARASFPTATEVRLRALGEQHMCKPVLLCVWELYEALGCCFFGCGVCLCAACRRLAVYVGTCARASFPTAAEVRLWTLKQQHMCKQDHWCVWGVCKAARVAFLGLQRVFVRGVRAFGGLCRHLRARELPNGSRGAFVGTQRTAHVQTRSFVCSGCLQGC